MGNHSSDCPLRKTVHLAEREDGNDNKVCCEPDSYGVDEEVYDEEDDEGQNYVVRKVMLMPTQEGNTQRHQLFWTRCTISCTLFELIIDSGSCGEAVRLSKLLIEKHHNPYTIR